jgi:hypothetical protein
MIGANCGFAGFTHQSFRNPVWFELAEAGFGSEGTSQHREALSALFNLSQRNTSDASELSSEELLRFADECVARIIECCPRVAVAMEKRVFAILTAAFSRKFSPEQTEFIGVANPNTGRATDSHVWECPIESGSAHILLVRAPSHPSRPDRLVKNSMSVDGSRRRYAGIRMTVDKFNREFPPITVFR